MQGAVDVLGKVAGSARHLFLATFLPALVVVAFIGATAAATDNYSEPASLSRLLGGVRSLDPGLAAVAIGAALALGVVFRPLTFTATQFFEGYWGTSKAAGIAMSWRIGAHIERRAALASAEGDRPYTTQEAASLQRQGYDEKPVDMRDARQRAQFLRGMEASRLLARFPDMDESMMPTRFGNALRRSELRAGQPYGLDGVSAGARLMLVAPDVLKGYVDAARTQMDACVALIVAWGLATVTSLAAFRNDGWWLLTALGTYMLGVIAYRGAVEAARDYGDGLEATFDLGRFSLYEAMGLPRPPTPDAEQVLTEQISELLSDREPLRHPYATTP